MERCSKIVSSYEMVHNEIEKLKSIMIKNFFPRPFLDKVSKHFLDEKFKVIPVCDTANKWKARVTFPHLGNQLKSCKPN